MAKKKYIIYRREVHIQEFSVEANSVTQAIETVKEDEDQAVELGFYYESTLDSDEWLCAQVREDGSIGPSMSRSDMEGQDA